MENAGYVSLSQQMALQRQMDLIANNVANMNTPGYKNQKMQFMEYLVQQNAPSSGEAEPKLSMVLDYGAFRDMTQGTMEHTGNPLDLAVEGDGYVTVEGTDGKKRYSRGGGFDLNDQREIVTSSGVPLLSDSGSRITIPANAQSIIISTTGQVSTESGPIATIGTARFDRNQFLQEQGGGLYATEEPPLPAENFKIRQGFREGSNVQPVQEMTRMIDVQRTYQAVQRNLQSEHERIRNTIQSLSKVNA